MAMRMKTKVLALAAALGAAPVHAADPSPGGIAGWDSLVAGLRDLEPKMLAKLSPEQRADPQVRQELGRLALEALAARTLEAISLDGDHPVFLPSINPTLNVFQPNADTIYKTAYVTPGGVYRLRGTRGSVRIAKLGQFTGSISDGPGAIRALAYDDLNALKVDATGHYDVILSPERPSGYAGDWWKLEAGAAMLLLRQVASDWSNEQDPSISIERLDRAPERPRQSAADLERRVRALADRTSASALAFVDHFATLRRDGFVNKLKPLDLSNNGALFGQFYYEGGYSLKDDEALVLEAKVPQHCGYYSTILTNEIWETTDWLNNQSSLNDHQSKIDRDGVLRIVISARDPGVANWLSTAGYPRGVVQGRWTDCNAQPVPSLRLVKLSALAAALPRDTARVTPDQRVRTVRDRNAAYQQRRYW